MPDVEFLRWLNGVGVMGLAFVLHQVLSGKLITRREFDAVVAQRDKWESRFDRATEYGNRAVQAGQTIAEKQSL